ncbi:MAG: DEAD/DEAH box helicase [Candidatus Aenigmarchaeota archaeon]|nr:DEAD/DEAH box helicase [Candidatus Aenigmarchaeota archaeon]
MTSEEIVRKVLEASSVPGLNPVQDMAVKAGLFERRNMVLAAPTASGKTLVAEMASLKTILLNHRKVVYIVPLRALASEKYEEFKKKYEPLGIRVGMSIGDYDQSDPWLANYDLIIVTSEKMDSLLRHGISWTDSIGLVVADEIHLLDSPNRGPTLEIVLTRFMHSTKPEILGLSATISNYEELAGWLKAEPVKSDYRPVKLYVGVCYDSKVNFLPKKEITLNPDETSIKELVNDTLKKKKQGLIFISTRKNAESAAEKLGELVKKHLTPDDIQNLSELSGKILHVLDHPTKQCERLAGCIKSGIAFHHAGLTNQQRSLVENSFREGVVKIIAATPTLAAGLNLPAWRVIIRDLKRYSRFGGMDYIPVLEIFQMAGRAGRPKWDTEGQAILMAKSESEAKHLWEYYIKGEPEKIYSKLGIEPVLRMHVLSLIASGTTPTKKSLLDFFSKTFYAHQYKDLSELERLLEKVIALLRDINFIESSGSPFRKASVQEDELKPTKIGRRVSELYIDPLTAHHLIKNMKLAEERGTNSFGVMHMISKTVEMFPLLGIRKSDMQKINELLVDYEPFLMEKPPNPWDIEYDDYIRSIKTAWFFNEWTEEAGEDAILDYFGVTPGELRVRLSNADWLLYSSHELALLLDLKNTLKEIRKTRLRVKYGIREELLALVVLRGVGRVRARTLYNSGLRKLDDLRKIPLESLERIIGPKVAREIKEQVV